MNHRIIQSILGADHLTSDGVGGGGQLGEGGWVIWFSHDFFFWSMCLHVIFSPSSILQEFFLCEWG